MVPLFAYEKCKGILLFKIPLLVMSTNVDEINLSESYKQKAKKIKMGIQQGLSRLASNEILFV
jgi:hypothetical protein